MKKRLLKKIICCASAMAVAATTLGVMPMATTEAVETNEFTISIDGGNITADTLQLGMVSANGSSRLLIDYKESSPEAYWELIDQLFNKETGIGLTHLKLEMGSDVDSSSGMEAATKRAFDEVADVTRGAGFQFAADVKSVYPDVSVDLLEWGIPEWAYENNDTHYMWYKETLDAAYDVYGLKFDYIGISPNEQGVKTTGASENISWMKYFAYRLETEETGRYDYSQIKRVAADEVTTANIATAMLNDEELMDAIDVIGIHYSTWSSDTALLLKEEYGKEIWYSEATAVTIDPELGKNATSISGLDSTVGEDNGLTGTNGALESAAKILNMYPQGGMTMYEFQPAISAYYDGAVYSPKELIKANTPWSGYYDVEVGAAVAAHFTRFLTDDMYYVSGACYGDGSKNSETGDGHGLVDTTNNYITLADATTGDYTMVFVNDSNVARKYTVSVANLAKAGDELYIWTTDGSTEDTWLRQTDTITPASDGTFEITIAPYSMVTATTTTGQKSFSECQTSEYQDESNNTLLDVNYTEDFNYSDEFISSRGGQALYFTDLSGAFEVEEVNGEKMLVQQIEYDNRPYGWGGSRSQVTTNPFTNMGETRWADYSAEVDVYLDTDAPAVAQNYAGISVRYQSTSAAGYQLKLYNSGSFQIAKGYSTKYSSGIKDFDASVVHHLKVTASGNVIKFYIDDNLVYTLTDSTPYTSGRVGLFSGYARNAFDDLEVSEVTGSSYISKIDALSDDVEYTGDWSLLAGDSYNYYNRTRAVSSTAGSSFSTTFTGTGVNLNSGTGSAATLNVEIDGVSQTVSTSSTSTHETSAILSGLDYGEHTLTVTVTSGEFTLDTIEVLSDTVTVAEGTDKNNLTTGISISDCTISGITESFVYDGTAHTPDVGTVTYNGVTLTEGVDYYVGYGDNVNYSKRAAAYIVGMGDYYGTTSVTYLIDKKDYTTSSITGTACKNSDGTYNLSFFDNDTGLNLVLYSDYSVVEYDVDAGTATIKAMTAGNYRNSIDVTLTVHEHDYEYYRAYEATDVSEGATYYKCTACGDVIWKLDSDVLLGDVNLDGKVTTADVGLANSHAKGVKTLTGDNFTAADVNLDGKVTTADVGLINSHAKGVKLLW